MLDFTEQALSLESLPESSVDTQTVSDSLRADTLADLETTAKTLEALAPWLEGPHEFVQDKEEIIE